MHTHPCASDFGWFWNFPSPPASPLFLMSFCSCLWIWSWSLMFAVMVAWWNAVVHCFRCFAFQMPTQTEHIQYSTLQHNPVNTPTPPLPLCGWNMTIINKKNKVICQHVLSAVLRLTQQQCLHISTLAPAAGGVMLNNSSLHDAPPCILLLNNMVLFPTQEICFNVFRLIINKS